MFEKGRYRTPCLLSSLTVSLEASAASSSCHGFKLRCVRARSCVRVSGDVGVVRDGRATYYGLGAYMRIVAALACALTLLPATIFAQAGSTGGTVGKEDKSVSGGEDQPQRRQEPNARLRHSANRDRSAPSSISGKWIWTQICDDGAEFSGAFELTQDSDGAVSGTATGSDGSGSVSGRFVGRKLTGTRSYLGHSNSITFTLTAGGSGLAGSESSLGHGTCKYQAKRS
jgi:hypothetical protein